MLSLLRMRKHCALAALLLNSLVLGMAQSAYGPLGGEYAITAKLPGDQVRPSAAINANGGLLVWQDNITDGDGLGISAQRLSSNLSPVLSAFRINQEGVGDQENAQVALLPDGGAVVVWQGGQQGFQKVWARFLRPDNTFATDDILVNTYLDTQQVNPVVAVLADGSVVVVWSSYGQDGSLQGIFGQRLSPTGEKLGLEFGINQTTALNQRNPAVAALASGGFASSWISEFMGGLDPNNPDNPPTYGARIYARIYDAQGNPQTGEIALSNHANLCATPALAGVVGGGFVGAWSEQDALVATNSWDVYARSFDAQGHANGDVVRVNTFTYGDQYLPRLASVGANCLVLWTAFGQDGSREGVFGRFLNAQAQPVSDELLVNTTTVGQQLDPAVVGDAVSRFLVVWTGYTYGPQSFDLFAQRYGSAQVVGKLPAPFVSPISQSRISVTWPPMSGYNVDHYELFVDGATQPISLTNNLYQMSGLAPGSTHSFKVLYQLADGSRSPISDSSSAKTWGEDLNGDGLPDDWQAQYWGSDPTKWPAGNVDSDGDGASNYQEFLAGTNPLDANSVLRTKLVGAPAGVLSAAQAGWSLSWNTQPGFIYQVQTSTNMEAWANFAGPRFASGSGDAVAVEAGSKEVYYRVIRMR